MSPNALQRSFAEVAEHGDEVPLFFYSYLFLRHPQTRAMFPPGMAAQRDRLVGALAEIVAGVDNLEAVVPFVEQLGRDHRKFNVVAEHYPAVGEALLATLRHFLGPGWTDDLAADWASAYGVIAEVMLKAADGEQSEPAYWQAEIIAHEQRGPDLAVITVRPEAPIHYLPGQSMSVQAPQRPRMWRFYSPANAPRADGSLEFHVRALDGGWVSSALVLSASVGDVLKVGPPVGRLTLAEGSEHLLMLAGGTGLAPLWAIAEQALSRRDQPERRITLFHEAHSERQLYDLARLEAAAAADPRLEVVPVARTGSVTRAEPGRAVDAALRRRRWADHDVYVCGSSEMVGHALGVLTQSGLDAARLRRETFGYRVVPSPTSSSGSAVPGSDQP